MDEGEELNEFCRNCCGPVASMGQKDVELKCLTF